VICFVPGPVDDAPGFTLDAGLRHEGQGTQNRRIVFDRNYVELVWIYDEGEVRARGLATFVARCAGRGCPFGLVARGSVSDRARFTEYAMPNVPGFVLWLLTEALADDDVPFVALIEEADPARRQPRARFGPQQADGIVRATFTAPTVPELTVRDAGFAIGAPALALELGDRVLRYGNTSG